ncbi:MAG: hypothetical protein RJB66_2650 [Pseudomonadota bacterium]|jgi:hypothetical protein
MSLLIQWLFFIQACWAVQIAQQSPDVVAQEEKSGAKIFSVKEGGLKFQEGNVKFDLFPNSEARDEDGHITLAKGSLRVRGSDFTALKVETPVARVTLTGSDFLIEYIFDRATMQVTVLEGSALLQGHYRDDILNIQVGEKGEFVGVPEADGPAFDILLKGRKAIRGHLKGPETMTAEVLSSLRSKYEIAQRKAEKKVVPRPKPGQICVSPFAKYNECLWVCKNNPSGKKECQVQSPRVECIREKCLANGQWGDRKALKGAAKMSCKTAVQKLGPCDY